MTAWPLRGLRLATPRLELRLGTDEDLDHLADLVDQGIHHPDVQPFGVAWTDQDNPGAAARAWHWYQRGRSTPNDWHLDLVVSRDNQVIGSVALAARDYPILREVRTGSYLGLQHHNQGYGTEMRAAVLHLAFTGLGAQWATSSAHADNPASNRVSEKLGYQPDGTQQWVTRGHAQTVQRHRLAAAHWTNPFATCIEGLEDCREWFGV